MIRRTRKTCSRAGHWLCVMLSLLVTTGFADSASGGVWQQSPQDSPQQQPQTPPAVEDDVLPWQPGLGQPISPSNRSGAANPNNLPAPAVPLPQAQPIPGPGSGQIQPPLQDHNVAPIPTGQGVNGNGATESITNSATGYPVIPAALVQQPGSAGAENGNDQQRGNANLIDDRITTVTRGLENLPNDAGQIWRTYDISPYTYMVKNTDRPQQAVIDWIVKETGTDMWFAEPLGFLSASRNQLHVYHTPQIQQRIKDIVDRFVQTRAAPQVMGLRMATIASPNWRSRALTLMQPVPIDATGIEAWLMSKENAAILMGQLRSRADYQEHNNGDIVITDGQKYVLSRTRPVEFLRSLAWVNQGYYQPVLDRIDVGYTVELSALGSLDGKSIEAIVGCQINQIEQLQPVSVQLPGPAGQSQTAELQIPQMVSWQANERFRWPADQVLVLSCGVVATPGPQRDALLGIPSLLNGSQGRADALMFIEFKGRAAANGASPLIAPTAAMPPVGVPRR